MKYLVFHPKDGEMIFFSNEYSARRGVLELGTHFYYPCKNMWSVDKLRKVVVYEDGEWITKSIHDLKCTCGCNL